MIQWKQVRLSFLFLGIAVCTQAAQLHVVIVDKSGLGFPDVLVIVRSLEGRGESLRALTHRNGAVPAQELAMGLYQIIATCPYGLCRTTVREFLVNTDPVELKLAVEVLPTTGNTFTIGRVKRCQVEVQNRDGIPVASADILVRDANAESQKWYQTGLNGKVLIDLLPGQETTIVAVHDGDLASRVLQPDQSSSKQKEILFRFSDR